jgi:hypothetical protein
MVGMSSYLHAIMEVSSMPNGEERRCPYCLGEGWLPKLSYIVSAALAPSGGSDTCPGCAGTGRLKPDTGDDATIDMLAGCSVRTLTP